MAMTMDEAYAPDDGTGLFARLGRRKLLVALGFGLTAAAVVAVFTALPQTYRASASLLFASNDAVLRSGDASAEAQRSGDPADIESQMLMLRSPRLARLVLDDPKVVEALVADCEATRKGTWTAPLLRLVLPPKSCDGFAGDIQAQLQRLAAGFSIGPSGRSRVIEVSFVSPVPETTVLVCNALVDAFLSDDRERKVATHDAAISWLQSEIETSGQELRRAELGIEAYRGEHGLVRGQQASATSERLSVLGQQLGAAQAAYALALSRLKQPGGDTQDVLNSRTVMDLKQQSAQLAANYAELRGRYGENYPAVLAAAQQKREIDGRLASESRRVGVSLQREVAAAQARVTELSGQYEAVLHDVGNSGGAEASIAIMVRDVEARREIYVDDLKKVNVLQTERRLLSGDARLVNHAEIPDRPWFPKKLPFVAVGMVVASAVGASVGLLRDRSDRTLRGGGQIAPLGRVPVTGYIPWVRTRRGSRLPVMHLYDASPLQEAVRALFGQLVLVPGRAPKTLMVSSSDVGEGKTFLTLALSLFAVTTRRRVLVIEADLRRPTFRAALNLPDGFGLSEFLRGEATLPEIITQYHGLSVITAGQPGMDSTELLSDSRFDMLMRAVAPNYDLILLDSPPTLLLMDAQVLARRVDGIVYCASLGRSRRDRVEQGIRSLGAAGGRVLGLAVSGRRGERLPGYEVPGLALAYAPARM